MTFGSCSGGRIAAVDASPVTFRHRGIQHEVIREASSWRSAAWPFPHGTLTLSPFGNDVVLEHPAPFETTSTVPLTLTFGHAGTVTIEATVTAPGTP
jgi:hypothetical protein